MHATLEPPPLQHLPLPSPAQLQSRLPLGARAAGTVAAGRRAVAAILDGRDPRWFVVVGPCSTHDPDAGLAYARRLAALAAELADTLVVVMRAYFEKPRTALGWKGLLSDPRLDGSGRIDEGLPLAREFLLAVNELGLPTATEVLDPLAPAYLGDLLSWAAIGARTVESQTHRELASSLQAPVGFKNATDGSLDSAVNAIRCAALPHACLGIDAHGRASLVRTPGQRHGHLVLRGGAGRPNYDSVSVALAEKALQREQLPGAIVVDCAHANSFKQHALQPVVLGDVVAQIVRGNRSIRGAMIESFLAAGNQPLGDDPRQLRYGCSITDPCVGWDTTEGMLREARQRLREPLRQRRGEPRLAAMTEGDLA